MILFENKSINFRKVICDIYAYYMSGIIGHMSSNILPVYFTCNTYYESYLFSVPTYLPEGLGVGILGEIS